MVHKMMNKKYVIVIWMMGVLLLSGCARIQHQTNLDSYPLYIIVQRGWPPVKSVVFSNSDISYEFLDKRIEEYINNHPAMQDEIVKNMRNYAISKGMKKEQVLVIAGKNPDNKSYNKQNEEMWVYGSIVMQGRVFIITFKDDYVVRIDDKYWDPCPQC